MKIIMLFPGYGSQYVGMAKELYDESRIVQEFFEEASNCLGINFVKLCFASSDAELGKMGNAYTATFLVSTALTAVLKNEGITPHAVAGYNLGEYAALFAAQGLNAPDGLYLLNKFATLYQELANGTEFGAVRVQGFESQSLVDMCTTISTPDSSIHCVIHNTTNDTIIAGHALAIMRLREQLMMRSDVIVDILNPEVGLHSSLMDVIIGQFSMYLEKVDFKDLGIPLISGVDGRDIIQSPEIKERILCSIHNSVRWDSIMDRVQEYDVILEVGPGTMLSSMVKTKYPDKIVMSINKRSDIEEVKNILGIQSLIVIPENQVVGEQNGSI